MAAKNERDSYEQVLMAKVAAWQAALDAYRAARAIDGSASGVAASPAPNGGKRPEGFDLPVGALRGSSLPDAIKTYLSALNRKQTNKQIAVGVRDAGYAGASENLEASVGSALFRLRQAGVVLRFNDGWDLAEHYPEHVRKKMEPATKPAKTRKRSKRWKASPTEQEPKSD